MVMLAKSPIRTCNHACKISDNNLHQSQELSIFLTMPRGTNLRSCLIVGIVFKEFHFKSPIGLAICSEFLLPSERVPFLSLLIYAPCLIRLKLVPRAEISRIFSSRTILYYTPPRKEYQMLTCLFGAMSSPPAAVLLFARLALKTWWTRQNC